MLLKRARYIKIEVRFCGSPEIQWVLSFSLCFLTDNIFLQLGMYLKKANFVSRNIGHFNKFALLPLCQPYIQFVYYTTSDVWHVHPCRRDPRKYQSVNLIYASCRPLHSEGLFYSIGLYSEGIFNIEGLFASEKRGEGGGGIFGGEFYGM